MQMEESTDIHINLRGQFGYQNAHIHTSKVLGTGSYGSVVKATLDHLPCAAKILHTIFFRDDDPGAVDFAARFELECNILRDLKHPCIVQFLGVVQDPTHRRPILLMELMDESLTHFLEHSPSSLPYHTQVNITYDIVQALAYLHSNRIIHRDLSSNNILLKGGIQAKVTDFGISKIVDANPGMTRNKVTQCPGTPAFMPPEALRAKPRYSDKLDTFSLGVLIVQIITRKFPAPADAEIVMEDDSSPTGEKIVPVPELERRRNDIAKVPSDHSLLPIALHCLKDKDRERPTAAQLCQRLGQLKTSQVYTDSERESQARRVSFEQQLRLKDEEKAAELAQLQEQMSQLARQAAEKERIATEKEHLASEKEREVAVLRRQLQTLQKAPPPKDSSKPVRRSEVIATIILVSGSLKYSLLYYTPCISIMVDYSLLVQHHRST